MSKLNYSCIHSEWKEIFNQSIQRVDPQYLKLLEQESAWLPGAEKIFMAFSLPLSKVQFILFGESPYPRAASANGFAFWDAACGNLWSDQGLDKTINRATSLRNFVKMLLVARHDLEPTNTSQEAIVQVPKTTLIESVEDLFTNLLQQGFMLLNASLVLSAGAPRVEAKYWLPFIEELLQQLAQRGMGVTLILLGNIAKEINKLPAAHFFPQFHCEHPYNISFITNPKVLNFFRTFDLLKRDQGLR